MAAMNDEKTAIPANDAWTGMLAISLLALVVGCILLFLDWRNYGGDKPSKAKLQQAPFTQQEEGEAGKEAAPAPEEKKGGPGPKKG
jgi:hypothetical protein